MHGDSQSAASAAASSFGEWAPHLASTEDDAKGADGKRVENSGAENDEE